MTTAPPNSAPPQILSAVSLDCSKDAEHDVVVGRWDHDPAICVRKIFSEEPKRSYDMDFFDELMAARKQASE